MGGWMSSFRQRNQSSRQRIKAHPANRSSGYVTLQLSPENERLREKENLSDAFLYNK